ncbi:MAG TPA: hypothetical protein VJW76_05385 [Verrucomicrobiae bacterium]|nr:hypothetical protein [Verrucomicrobiae bacterium]
MDTGPDGPLAYIYAKGSLLKKEDNGQTTLVWERRLYNLWAPMEVLISNSGKFVVTIDDWGGNRFSTNAVVIYNAKGNLIKRFAVSDILTESEREKVIRSPSGDFWGGGHRIEESRNLLVLRIVTNKKMPTEPGVEFREKYIRLDSGELFDAPPPAGAKLSAPQDSGGRSYR